MVSFRFYVRFSLVLGLHTHTHWILDCTGDPAPGSRGNLRLFSPVDFTQSLETIHSLSARLSSTTRVRTKNCCLLDCVTLPPLAHSLSTDTNTHRLTINYRHTHTLTGARARGLAISGGGTQSNVGAKNLIGLERRVRGNLK